MATSQIAAEVERETAIDRLADDVRDLLTEHLPLVQVALANTHCEEPASVTIKVAWKPATEGTETKAGKPLRVEVSAKASLPSQTITRRVEPTSIHSPQMALWAPE
jgi:hypothetical protein